MLSYAPATAGSLAPPDFGPPKYSRAMQSQHPGKPYTRLVKDALRVGKWLATNSDGGQSWWQVTRQTLKDIAASFQLARRNGVAPNLIWDHGNPLTGIVSGRDLLAEIDDVRVEGDTLWIAAYVTPSQARQLRLPVNKVSIGYEPLWRDGQGRPYPHFLSHVGVVDLPVVDSQGPFLTLSRRKANTMPFPKMTRSRRLALSNMGYRLATEGEGDAPPEEDTVDTTVLTIEGDGVDTLIDLIDQVMMEGMGIGLPEGTTGETLVHDLQVLAHALFKPAAEEAPAPADTVEDVAAGEPVAMSTRSMARTIQAAIAPLQRQLKTLSTQVNGRPGTASNNAAADYMAELNSLAADGRINAGTRLQLAEEGAATGYRLSVLAPYRNGQQITSGGKSRRLATGAAPQTNGKPDLARAKKLAEVNNGKRSMDDPEI